MEISKQSLETANLRLENSLGTNYTVDTETPAEAMKQAIAEVGQRNNTALNDGEVAEFLTEAEYENNIGKYVKLVRNTANDNFSRLYALVNRYFIVDGKKVGEHQAFINVGGMVRTHFDMTGVTPDANGKMIGARRTLIPGDFNTKLDSYKLPWAMLTKFLAGKKVKASRSTDKLWFQRFESNQPVRDEYREQNYLVYNFSK